MQIIGVIAGKGNLPRLIFEHCVKNNLKCYMVFIDSEPNFTIDRHLYINCSIGKVGKILNFFKKKKVTDILLAGGVQKPNFTKLKIDIKGFFLLSKILKNKLLGDNILLSNIISYIEKHNFKVIATDELLPNMHLKEGSNNKLILAKKLKTDIDIAVNLFRQISAFDIGQSLIIQNGRIIALEAAEGTDKMIIRSAPYIESNQKYPAILVKISKKNQDRRADLPTVGIETINNLSKAGIKILVLDVENSLVIDKEKLCLFAEKKNILIYGIIPDYE